MTEIQTRDEVSALLSRLRFVEGRDSVWQYMAGTISEFEESLRLESAILAVYDAQAARIAELEAQLKARTWPTVRATAITEDGIIAEEIE